MSSEKIEIPRELVQRVAKYIDDGLHLSREERDLLDELRALLDATAETEAVHEVRWNSIHGPEGWEVVDAPTYHRCTGRLWDRRITHKPAAQPQGDGEPVAWMQPGQGGMCISSEVKLHSLKMGGAPASAVSAYSVPLYAEQPAPAKSVDSVNTRLREALEGMVEYFPEGHSDGECFSVERAREVLAVAATRPALASGGGTTS